MLDEPTLARLEDMATRAKRNRDSPYAVNYASLAQFEREVPEAMILLLAEVRLLRVENEKLERYVEEWKAAARGQDQ